MVIDGTRLTEAERTVLTEALDTYIRELDSLYIPRNHPTAHDEVAWKQYVAGELRGQVARR